MNRDNTYLYHMYTLHVASCYNVCLNYETFEEKNIHPYFEQNVKLECGYISKNIIFMQV